MSLLFNNTVDGDRKQEKKNGRIALSTGLTYLYYMYIVCFCSSYYLGYDTI